MSHLTTYKSNVLVNTDPILLKKSLKELGIILDENVKTVKNSYITTNVDAAFIVNGNPISLGIVYEKNKNGNTEIKVSGDFWGTGIDQNDFIDQLAQTYKKYDVIDKCESQGWNLDYDNIYVDNETDEIVIQASRYVV